MSIARCNFKLLIFMKIIQVSPKDYLNIGNQIIPTDGKRIKEVLIKLNSSDPDIVIIPIDQYFQDIEYYCFGGLELIKHIRLTPELENIYESPIVCLHWHSIEYYIKRDVENFILLSPGIYCFRLPVTKIDFLNLNPLNQSLNPYLFGSLRDEILSDHTFRNKIAIKQFEEQVNNSVSSFIDKPIWHKKLFYKNYGKEFNANKNFKASSISLKILLLDDEADKWEPALKKALPNCKITKFNSASKVAEYFQNNLVLDQHEIIQIDISNQSAIQKFSSKCLRSKFDLIFLDMHFKKKKSKLDLSTGIKFLEYLHDENINFPVYIFSASHQDFSSVFRRYPFIVGRYIKGLTPINSFLESIESIAEIIKLGQVSFNVGRLINLLKNSNFVFKKKLIDKNGNLNTTPLNSFEIMQIISNLSSVQTSMNNQMNGYLLYSKGEEKEREDRYNKMFLENLGVFGIIQEYRISKNCPNNKLSNAEKNLITYRNIAFHSNTKVFGKNAKVLLNKWKSMRMMDKTREIEKAFNKTFDGLLFGI